MNVAMSSVTVTDIYIYPVKSCRGVRLSEAAITPLGFALDRAWMIVNPEGTKITQRECPSLAQVSTLITREALVLSHASSSPLGVPLASPLSGAMNVDIWGHKCSALREAAEADTWISQICGTEARLVRFDPSHVRKVDAKWAGETGAATCFSDVLPFLITSEESLDALNKYRAEEGLAPSSMNRFRPNIVVRGIPAFSEESISALSLPREAGTLELVRPCSRCPITNTDQETGERESRGNLQILAKYRTLRNYLGKAGAMFGVQALPLLRAPATLRVGDVLEARSGSVGVPPPISKTESA